MTKRDISIASELARIGLEFSQELRDENRRYFRNLDNTYFAIASAIGLTWTRHARFDEEFITYASDFIDSKVKLDTNMSQNYCFRFGPEQLDNTLINFQQYYSRIKQLVPDFNTCDIHDLSRLQQILLNRLDSLRVNKIIKGIGPWLFTGPFKIILSDQDRFWTQEGINAIILPTGIEVDRGIHRLVRARYSFMNDFDLNWLEQETNSLLESYATYNLVHTFITNIGKISNTPAIHINSALFLYGRDEI